MNDRRNVRIPAWLQALLRVPLLWKLVIANGVLVGALGALALLQAPDGFGAAGAGWAIAAWGLALVLAIGTNAVLAHLALRPIRNVEDAARRVEAGEMEARVRSSPLADRELHRVIQVLNRMLASLEAARAQEREMAARLLEAEEGERKRIADELLADTAQMLSTSLLHFSLASRGIPAEDEAPKQAMAAARADVLDAVESINRIARGLRPPELDELGAVAALEMQARRLAEQTSVGIELRGDRVDAHLSPKASLAMYRILQEGLVNAVLHGRPERVTVEFRLDEDTVRASVTDNGIGFDPAAIGTRPGRHIGILGMHERARHAGGSVEIASTPLRGTCIIASFPRVEATPGRSPAASRTRLDRPRLSPAGRPA